MIPDLVDSTTPERLLALAAILVIALRRSVIQCSGSASSSSGDRDWHAQSG